MTNDSHLKADLLIVLVTLIAAAGWAFSKETLQGLPPFLFIGVRFLLAGLLITAIGASQLRRLNAGDLRRTCATGAVMGVAMLSWILGLHHARNMGVGAFITSLGVVLAPVVGWALFNVRVTTSTWIAVIVAAVGLGCLSLEGGLAFAPSDLYFLAAAFAFAVHFNLNTRFAARIPVLSLTAVQLTIAGGMALLISTLTERWPAAVSGEVMGWLMASAFVATSLRFFLQIKAQGMAPLSHTAIIMTLEPVWTALVGRAWFGERMSRMQLMGCAIIFCALLINRWRWFLRADGRG